jgi:signal transduction histidine kinase
LKIKDTGMGIEDSKLKTLFNPFTKVNNIAREKNNKLGCDLGLNISKKLSQALGGDI